MTTSTNAHVAPLFEQVLLSTALVLADSQIVKSVPCRALLDPGLQTNFITEELVQTFHLRREKIRHVINGIGDNIQYESSYVTVQIKSLINKYKLTLQMVVVPKITGRLPTRNIQEKCQIPNNVHLADPEFNTS